MDYRHKFKCKIIKHLEHNTGQNLNNLVFSNEFSDITPEALFRKKNC